MFFCNIMNRCTIIVAWVLVVSGCSKPYSDEQLIKFLSENKTQFEQLINLSEQCLKAESTIFWSRETKGGSGPCSRIMKDINIRGMVRKDSGAIFFYMNDDNYRSNQKGLIYSEIKISPLFDSLDKKPSGIQPYKEGYKQIGNSWYIYYVSI